MKFCLLQSDGEHQAHRYRFRPAGAEQPEYWSAVTDAATTDPGAVLPAPDADDGDPEQHRSGPAADSRPATASTAASAP
jgi:hypothetical protein